MKLSLPHPKRRLAGWSLVVAITAVMCAPLALAADAKPAAPEKGFVSLLGPEAQKQWIGYDKKEWPKGWELKEGVLHRGGSGGDLMTAKEYGDFDLRFEWKITPGGNSGVMYRVSESKEPAYYTGPEYQVLDNAKHADGKNPKTSAGSIYALYPPAKDVTKKVGEWNEGRIVLKGNRVEHYLNGEKTAEAELGGEDWNKRVAESKFSAWKKFGKNRRGHIVLQDHGDEVWFRNVRIKELGEKEASK
jgi:hypothetical protein